MVERILLIDVEYGKGNQLQSNWSHHPLGLMYLAAAARRRFPAIETRIFHTTTSDDPPRDLQRILRTFRPDVVGMRALSIFQGEFHQVSRIVRRHAPDAHLVGGGPYSSCSFGDVLSGGYVDIVVIGEGEVTFTELVAHLNENPELPTDLSGTAVLRDGEVKRNPARPLVPVLDDITWPAYDLIDFDDYQGISNHAFQEADSCAFIESSRGCPYRCYYCHIAREKTTRNRSPESVIGEMEAIHERYGIDDFVFVDDIFNVPREAGKQILRLLIKRLPKVRVNFPNGLRADQLDVEFLDLLEQAGTVHMALAIETASPRLQKVIGKHLKLDKTKEMLHAASQRFIVCGFFMVGFPSETVEEAEATVDFARDLNFLAQPVLSIVRVYPETILWDALNPTPSEAELLRSQTNAALQPKLMDDPHFYGDLFPAERVPLKGDDIKRIRWRWMKEVLVNPERLRNSYGVMKRYFTEEQIVLFNKNLFDNAKFNNKHLHNLLKVDARQRLSA